MQTMFELEMWCGREVHLGLSWLLSFCFTYKERATFSLSVCLSLSHRVGHMFRLHVTIWVL